MYLENIKIENRNGTMVVSSREVADNFEKEHSKVLRAIQDKIEVNPILASPQYFMESTYLDKSNRQSKEYLMTRDGFSFLVMGFTGSKADEWKLKYIEAFNQMEKVIMQGLPTTYKEALQQLLEKEEAREKLQITLDELQPKVLFANSVESSHTSILIGDLAKLIRQNGYNIGQNRLFKWLRENNYLIKSGERRNMPTQFSMEKELFEVKERTVNNPDGSIRITKTTMVTGKGQVYFINKFLNEELDESNTKLKCKYLT